MVYILHISDLHFVKNAASYHTEEILAQEAARKLKNVPRGKKLLIITGDFHNFWEKDYDKAEVFLKRLVSEMDIDIQQDVFVIPGNHDVGNEDALKPLLELKDPLWKKHMKSCLAMLKDGDKDYIEERLQAFRLYNKFVQNIGIYDINKGEDYPASSHVRSWRGNLNILHLNSALIADGKQKDNQMTDVDKAANSETWEHYYDKCIPALAIGHNNFFDLNKDQRMDLALTFSQKNVSAYLCGDRHRTEQDPEYQMIRIESGHKQGEEIPNLVAAKGIADGDDTYSEVGYCWHYWDEKNNKVTVEFRKWTKFNLGNTVPAGEKGEYYMRREKTDGSDRGEMVESDGKSNENSKESTKIPITLIPASVDLIGREDDITAIRDVLAKNNVVLLRADGGVGKTALVARIINTVKGEIERGESPFKHVAWITSTGDLKSDLSKIETPSIETAGSIDEKFKVACTFLQKNSTFLIIDNMDDLPGPDEISILNTISGRTKILITTRVKIGRFKQYQLKPLDNKAAVSLFYRHYLDKDEAIMAGNKAEEIYVEKIVKAASCNALLVELISKMAYWEYKYILDKLWAELEKDVFRANSETGIETTHANSHSFDELPEGYLKLQVQIRNLYNISGLDDTKQELMRFISVFPAETIIFADAFKWAGFKVSDLKYLTERGWIEKAGEGYLIHALVKGSVELQKKEFDVEEYKNLIYELIDVDKYLPTDRDYVKVVERIVVPDTVCRLLGEKDTQNEDAAALFYNMGNVCYNLGDYARALEYYNKARVIFEKVQSADHPDTASTYNNMAIMYKELGDYAKALEYHEKARVIREKVLGLDDPNTGGTYGNMANIYANLGDYARALEYYNKARVIFEKVQSAYHPEIASLYNNMANVYIDLGDYAKSLEYYEKARVIREKVLVADHPDIATTYNNIANVYIDLGDYAKSLEYCNKARVIREKVLGADHRDTAETYISIANVYNSLGEYAKALEYYDKALVIREKVRGLDHPDTASLYNNLAVVYSYLGDYAKSLEYYEKARVIEEKVLGADHPNIATTYNNMANVYIDLGDYAKALEYCNKARVIKEKVLGADHPDTAATYNSIANVYNSLGEYAKALEYYDKALVIRVKKLGQEHPDTATSYNDIATVYYKQHNFEKDLEYFEKALVIREKVLGLEHPDTAMTYYNLGEHFAALHKKEKSKNFFQKAYDIFLKIFGSDHPKTKNAKESLDRVNQKLDK